MNVPGFNVSREELWLQAKARADLERFIICGCWQFCSTQPAFSFTVSELHPSCWSDPAARAGAEAIGAILKAGDEPDMIRVATELRRMGDQSSFLELSQTEEQHLAIAPSHLRSAIEEIREMGARRRRLRALEQLMTHSKDLTVPVKRIDDMALAAFAELGDDNKRQTGGWLSDGLAEQATVYAEDRQKEGFVFTPWPALNRHTQGFGKGEVIVLAAWPKIGKTAFLMNVCQGIAAAYGPVYVEEFEMSLTAIVRRSAVQLRQVQAEDLTPADFTRAADEAPPVYVECAAGGLDEFVSRVRLWMLRHPNTVCVAVDYMGLMQNRNSNNQVNEAGKVSGTIKALATEYQIPFIILQQFNRKLAERPDKTPRMEDLRDGQHLVQDAHKIMFLHKPWFWGPASDAPRNHHDPSYVELHLVANRDGQTGMIPLKWNARTLTFSEWVESPEPARDPSRSSNRRTAWNDWGNGAPAPAPEPRL